MNNNNTKTRKTKYLSREELNQKKHMIKWQENVQLLRM